MNRMIGTKEAADKWGYSQATVWEWCRTGRIKGTVHGGPGATWLIPADARCPLPPKKDDTELQSE